MLSSNKRYVVVRVLIFFQVFDIYEAIFFFALFSNRRYEPQIFEMIQDISG